jgi:hypothetical protein
LRRSFKSIQDNLSSMPTTLGTSSTAGLREMETVTTINRRDLRDVPAKRSFVDRCLIIRILYEQCGHIFSLSIHELPCQLPYYGILPSTSSLAQAPCCSDIAQYLIMKHNSCVDCRNRPVKPNMNFQWFRIRDNAKTQLKRIGHELPMKDIIQRRACGKKLIDIQDSKIKAKMRGK